MSSSPPHLVVVGVGGIGLAVARRLGPGHVVDLADYSADQLDRASRALAAEGLTIATHEVDVTSAPGVAALAAAVGAVGPVSAVVHTAGVSPVQATTAQIYGIDLLGAVHAIDAFQPLLRDGATMTVIASMAGHLASLDRAAEQALATTSAAELLDLGVLDASTDSATGYMIAKRGVQLRVRAAARVYGGNGARINSVSPGIVHTPMGVAELSSPYGEVMQSFLDTAPAGRIATPGDIAAAVAFLASREASYITGTDLLVDGGVVAGL